MFSLKAPSQCKQSRNDTKKLFQTLIWNYVLLQEFAMPFSSCLNHPKRKEEKIEKLIFLVEKEKEKITNSKNAGKIK